MEEAEADFLPEPCCDAYETHDGLMVAMVSTFKGADLKFKTAASSAVTHRFHYASGAFSTRPARTTAFLRHHTATKSTMGQHRRNVNRSLTRALSGQEQSQDISGGTGCSHRWCA